MKNLLQLRNNKMNNILRSTLASSLIALTMMSCTKENIEPAAVSSSLENARMRSNLATDNNATTNTGFVSAENNDQALIIIQTNVSSSQAAYRIFISRQATVHISRIGEPANQFSEYRLDPNQFTNLLDYIHTYHSADQDYTPSNSENTFKAEEVEFRSCSSCDPTAIHNSGNAQERRAFTSMINEVDRIINLQSLINIHIKNEVRN